METRPKTIISDIDGVIFEHTGDISELHLITPILLPGVKEKWINFDRKGYKIVLITGRRESTRKKTEEQLTNAGIFYDQLIMGVGGGPRVLINDRKEGSTEDTAIAVNLIRNAGLKDASI